VIRDARALGGARGAILVDPRSGRRGRSRATTSERSAAAPPGGVSPNGNTERRIAASTIASAWVFRFWLMRTNTKIRRSGDESKVFYAY
jgi:hypothetical protein